MRSFVLGNGKSRLQITYEELKPHGKIYACNAVYREFSPDYLIAVDPKMIIEINQTGYQLQNQVWTNPHIKYKEFQGFNYFKPSLGWSSGPTALQLATEHKAKEVYILGFDFTGDNGLLNNVYENSNNYRKSTDPATYYGNWQRQTEHIIKTNINTKYFRVTDRNFYDPQWQFPNFKNISYEVLREKMSSWSKTA